MVDKVCHLNTHQEENKIGDKLEDRKINSYIKSDRVRVIDDEGNQLGVMPTSIAVSKASNRGYDLVEVSPNTNPPVCKIMDYGKFQFNEKKKLKKNKARSKVHLKEIRMNTVISEHDMGTKLNQCCKFLHKGYKVKLAIKVNDRLRDDETKGFTMVDTITEALTDLVSIAKQPLREGRFITTMFSPL
jgi:translation initiation factor IF-3